MSLTKFSCIKREGGSSPSLDHRKPPKEEDMALDHRNNERQGGRLPNSFVHYYSFSSSALFLIVFFNLRSTTENVYHGSVDGISMATAGKIRRGWRLECGLNLEEMNHKRKEYDESLYIIKEYVDAVTYMPFSNT